jgi:ABC-type transporter Mla subunit MlaD
VTANSSSWTNEQNDGTNRGWIGGFLVILAVLVFGAALWFTYHP